MRWLDAFRRWAMSDRIRASPREGKLLRLPVGACVRIGDSVARVIDRTTTDGGVTYTCQSTTGEFQLLVSLSLETQPAVSVRIGNDSRTRDVAVHELDTSG